MTRTMSFSRVADVNLSALWNVGQPSRDYFALVLKMSKKASCGRSTVPIRFIRRLLSF